MSRLDPVHAFRRIPPKCRIGASFRLRPCIRRNTVTSPRKPDACRTLAAEVDWNAPVRPPPCQAGGRRLESLRGLSQKSRTATCMSWPQARCGFQAPMSTLPICFGDTGGAGNGSAGAGTATSPGARPRGSVATSLVRRRVLVDYGAGHQLDHAVRPRRLKHLRARPPPAAPGA
jgi:hypothetical protein